MSRIFSKLELHHYIERRRSGNDKIVSLDSTFEKADPTQEPATMPNNSTCPDT
jgi:hypothetical protein